MDCRGSRSSLRLSAFVDTLMKDSDELWQSSPSSGADVEDFCSQPSAEVVDEVQPSERNSHFRERVINLSSKADGETESAAAADLRISSLASPSASECRCEEESVHHDGSDRTFINPQSLMDEESTRQSGLANPDDRREQDGLEVETLSTQQENDPAVSAASYTQTADGVRTVRADEGEHSATQGLPESALSLAHFPTPTSEPHTRRLRSVVSCCQTPCKPSSTVIFPLAIAHITVGILVCGFSLRMQALWQKDDGLLVYTAACLVSKTPKKPEISRGGECLRCPPKFK